MNGNYSLFDYGGMIGPACHMRVAAYTEALRRAITADSIVLDIGTGVGFFALLAAKFGARHVYAVEPNDAIHLARRLAKANDVDDRISFIQDLSTNITLPQPADVIVSDIGGALPFLGAHIPSIVDARQRFLALGGVLIPHQASVWAAVVSAPQLYAMHTAPWEQSCYGLNLQTARTQALNSFRKANIKPEQLLTESHCWAQLNYRTITNPHAKVEWTFPVTRLGEAHGLALWSAYDLGEGIAFSNAPDQPRIPVYRQLFFPWLEPVLLEQYDLIQITLQAHLQNGKYVWSWNSLVLTAGKIEKARFRQASLPILGAALVSAAAA